LPNENYAREILELHTLGRGAYLGVAPTTSVAKLYGGVTLGFSDQDILQASRAFSGWTLEQGQMGAIGPMPNTGRFAYNRVQHNTQAGQFMGIDLSPFRGDMEQGNVVLDIIAYHPLTADFVIAKLARRIFGDAPPPDVIARAKTAWMVHRNAPDQIGRVLRAILLDGPEIGNAYTANSKLRRPYERIIAFFRLIDATVNAFDLASSAATALGDGLFVWPTPEGRPDTDAQWLSTSANVYNWNLLLLLLSQPQFRTTLAQQTPADVSRSPTALVEYWVGRMVGYALRPPAMNALIVDAASATGAMGAYASGGITNIENALKRLVALIGCSAEFGIR
ncbi:MAG: DUF1800 family protein, partial [Rhodospirillaceae bacterium]|nr:DUF1800 family protein [Rhodospirillaceae bacterium]